MYPQKDEKPKKRMTPISSLDQSMVNVKNAGIYLGQNEQKD